MNLPDFHNHDGLNRLRKQLGAPLLTFDPDIDRHLSQDGVASENLNLINEHPDGSLVFKGRKVILYIRDVKGDLPKYHIVNCPVIKGMRTRGKAARYVLTRRTDGEFLLYFPGHTEPTTKTLEICKSCLKKLQRDCAPNRFGQQTWFGEPSFKWVDFFDGSDMEFSLDAWFHAIDDAYELPPIDGLYGPLTAPLTAGRTSGYPAGWKYISWACRERANWRCMECGINLQNDSRFLHAHHIDRDKQNNTPENLIALCFGCHSEQEGRGHQMLKRSPEHQQFVQQYGSIRESYLRRQSS